MAILFEDRQSKYPGRYYAKWEDGTSEYITLTRADQPYTEGTPLTSATFNTFRNELKPLIVTLSLTEDNTYIVDKTNDDLSLAHQDNRPILVYYPIEYMLLSLVQVYVDVYDQQVYNFSNIFNGIETSLTLVNDSGSNLVVQSFGKVSIRDGQDGADGEDGERGLGIYPVSNPNNSAIIDASQIDVPDYITPQIFDQLIDVETGNLWRITGMSATGTYTLTLLGSMSGSDGEDGASGLAIYPFEQYSTPQTWVEPSRITIPEGREIQVGDLLIETNTYTLYRVSQMVDESITDSYIGTEKLCDFPISVFQSYADKKLANALTKTVEGENIIALKDVSPLTHDISLAVASRNLLVPPWSYTDPFTRNGITFDTQDDGSVAVTGTATDDAEFVVRADVKLSKGTYVYRVFGSASELLTCHVSKYSGTTMIGNIAEDKGNGATFVVTDEDAATYTYRFNLYIQSKYGHTFTGEQFYPMLVKGSTVPTQYTMGFTDDTEITLSVIGKNLFEPPWKYADSANMNGITYKVQDDRSLVVTGTATGDSFYLFKKDVELPPGTYVYTLFGNENKRVTNSLVRTNKETGEVIERTTQDENASIIFTVTEDEAENCSYQMYISIYPTHGAFNGERFFPMLVKGDTAPNKYEQYVLYDTVTIAPNNPIDTLQSQSSDMTVVSEAAGVTLAATYNRDVVKVIERIETALGL